MTLRGIKRSNSIALLLIIITLCPVLLGASTSHTDKFYINDYADVLSEETEEYIFENAVALDRQTTAQICVLTVNSTDGQDISEYAVETFRQWGIGDEEKDNGVLILLSVDDREMWVTTGYGIEGTLTDTRLGQFRDEYAIPYYSENDFDTGTKELFSAILSYVMTEEYGLEALEGYEDVVYFSEDEFDIVFELIVLAIVVTVYFIAPHGWYKYLIWYDLRHGTKRARAFRKRYNKKNQYNNKGGFGPFFGGFGGGRGGGGGGFGGGGGSSGGGGAGGGF